MLGSLIHSIVAAQSPISYYRPSLEAPPQPIISMPVPLVDPLYYFNWRRNTRRVAVPQAVAAGVGAAERPVMVRSHESVVFSTSWRFQSYLISFWPLYYSSYGLANTSVKERPGTEEAFSPTSS